jgi:pimeloyl-ACP methyl ester carboxylesterase
MGGKLAMAFSVVYPEKIVSLTVADIAPKNYLKSASSDTQYEMHKLILDTLSELDLSKFTSRNEIQKEIGTKISDKLIIGFVLKNLKRIPLGFEWKINIDVLRINLDHILSGVDISDNYNIIPSTRYPVLFIRGGLSGYIQDADYAEIRRMYPNAEIIILEGTTHFLHTEKPDEFASIYLDFLKTVD